MGKPSHIPLFPDAYLRDTTHLSTEEHGAYFLLLMAAWGSEDCTLPNDERRLAALAKVPVNRWRKIAPTVLEFWSYEKGRLFQKRLQKEWRYVREKRGKARAAIEARWNSERGYGGIAVVCSDVKHLGGGGGGGVLSHDGGFSVEVSSKPFRVVEGGGK